MKISIKKRLVETYSTDAGKHPYLIWLGQLKDKKAKAKIIARVERAAFGNFGVYVDLKDGVFELKENFGPGYRIYFGLVDDEIILLVSGGDKGSQKRDIKKAKQYLADHISRSKK